jgi:hypothetical protein
VEKQLVIGFGTGRSGTTSLCSFLNAHEGVRVLHEGRLSQTLPGHPFSWTGDDEPILSWIAQIISENDQYQWIGDVGMYYINYVEVILSHYPETKFICMQRPMEAVVSSYMKWVPQKNHWMIHDGSIWKHDPKWDKAYPKFESTDKEEAIRQYWTQYAALTQELMDRFPENIKTIHLEDFNTKQCRDAILDLINYSGKRNVGRHVTENTLRDKMNSRRVLRFKKKLWKLKQKLIGKPGKRGFPGNRIK